MVFEKMQGEFHMFPCFCNSILGFFVDNEISNKYPRYTFRDINMLRAKPVSVSLVSLTSPKYFIRGIMPMPVNLLAGYLRKTSAVPVNVRVHDMQAMLDQMDINQSGEASS
jgi:hypothetical protein